MDQLNYLYQNTKRTMCTRLAEDASGSIVPYLWRKDPAEHNEISAAVQLSNNDYFERVDVICKNDGDREQEIKIFFVHEAFQEVSASFYSPADSFIYLYGKQNISLLNGSNYASISIMERKHKKVVYQSMENGQIIHSPLARGLVICTTMYKFSLEPGVKKGVSNWMITGSNKEEAMLLDYLVKNQTSIYD